MQLLKYKRLTLIVISLSLIFALGVMTSVAQEKMKDIGKIYMIDAKMEVMKIDDTEGHLVIIGESKGVNVLDGRGFGSGKWNFSELHNQYGSRWQCRLL